MRGWLQSKIKIGPWVWNSIGNARAWLVEAGKNVIRGLWDGINAMSGWIMSKMRGLLDGLKKMLPFSPPKDPTSPLAGSGQIKYAGMSIGRQLAEGMASMAGDVSASARYLAEQVQQGISGELGQIGARASVDLGGDGLGGPQGASYNLNMYVSQADTTAMQSGFRRLELLSGAA